MNYFEILKRRFSGEWSIDGNDYDSLIWYSNTPKPTKEQLDAFAEEIDLEIANELKAKADKKHAAEAKLAALGLTADDLRALGLG